MLRRKCVSFLSPKLLISSFRGTPVITEVIRLSNEKKYEIWAWRQTPLGVVRRIIIAA